MTSTLTTAAHATPAPATTTTASRLLALGRAELTLLLRSRAALITALLVPAVTAFSMRGMVKSLDLGGTGLSIATILLPGSLGLALIFSIYSNLVGVYVTRRESLVLKRLRTGEVRDWEIFVGGALPALLLALVQSVLLVIGLTVVLDPPAPAAPHLAVLGLVIGAALLVAAGALTAAVTRTAESAQLTFLPFWLVSMVGSGMFVPREVLPGIAGDISAWLPFSPVMDLLRGGWTGSLDVGDQVRLVLAALAWTAVAVVGVRRWFRWSPRH
ncbi:ABC-2 type transporter [Streptomyces sp. ADI96-02]|uniref:ABC transporter permease n=1 Tax=unclassified Streptomyces TaxID=2593676 RepID=UPI000F5555F5|nr:ABC transporter permease [Streptomyces sp. ADI96-02]RPK55057.1 ABC-2 type transporter [Streptomyces sp. ADI96-02]